jgi:tRNA pseudouridine55 synthase
MDGIILLDKPLFYTSHDIVDIVRHKIGMRRVGHAGSLDPMATGLVIVLIGKSTRLFDLYMKDEKEYE